MSRINILCFILVVMAVVPIRSTNWFGTFQLGGFCNTTACCCPSSDLVIKRNGINGEGSLNVTGFDCKVPGHHDKFLVSNATTISIASLGTFTLRSDAELDVLLEQNTTNRTGCLFTMTRIVLTTIVTTDTSNSSNHNHTTHTTQATENGIVSNHGSICLIFISIIMAAMSITRV